MSENLWFGTSGPHRARIAIVGEAWGYEESMAQKPFVGQSGQELTRILADAGIDRSECFLTNVVPERPTNNEMWRFFHPRPEKKAVPIETFWGLNPQTNVHRGINKLYEQLQTVRPAVVLALGNYALWALTEEARISYTSGSDKGPMEGGGRLVPSGIMDFRGSMLFSRKVPGEENCFKVLPLLHPAAIVRDWALRHPTVHDLKLRVPLALANDWTPKYPQTIIHRPTFQQATAYFDSRISAMDAGRSLEVSIDIETFQGLITCIGFCAEPSYAITIPLIDKENANANFHSYWTPKQEAVILRLIQALCTHRNFGAIGQNFLYDQTYIAETWGFIPRLSFDTMLAQHLLFPGTPKDLGYLSSFYCKYHRYWKDDNREWGTKDNPDSHFKYNAEDCLRTLEIATVLRDLIKQIGRWPHYEERLENHALALEMMQRGVRYDRDARDRMKRELLLAAEDRKLQMFRFFPQETVKPDAKSAWFASPTQTATVLYEILKLPEQRNRKTKSATADAKAIETLRGRYPEFKRVFLALEEIRSLGVYDKNFFSATLDRRGRMCCSFNPGGTEEFRWSSSKSPLGLGGNLQNIPSGDETSELRLPNVRSLFLPDLGYALCEVDLKGADAQVVAWETEDEDLKAAFRAGLDVHSKNAEDMLGAQFTRLSRDDPMRKKIRQDNKVAVHGSTYLATPRTLAISLGWTIAEAETWQRRWFSLHPKAKTWHKKVEMALATSRMVTNAFGYSRIFYDRPDTCLTNAVAWIPASTVALASFRGAVQVRKRFPTLEFLLQVHDSLVFQLPLSQLYLLSEIRPYLAVPIPYNDPLTIPLDLKVSTKSWGEAKDAQWDEWKKGVAA